MSLKLKCESEGTLCQYFHYEETGLDLIVCSINSEGVYGNIIIDTPMISEAPLSYGVERMIHGGSDSFGKDFIWRLAREISGAFVNSKLSSDYTCYSITAETDSGLIAMLLPYLDSIFCTKFTTKRYNEVIAGNASQPSEEAEWMAKIYPPSSLYSKAPMPTVTNLARCVSLQELTDYHRQYYTLQGTTIIVGGPVNADEFRDVLDACQSQLKSAMAVCKTIPGSLYPTIPPEAPKLIQPNLPTLPKHRPTTTRDVRGKDVGLCAAARTMSAPLVRFRSVIDDPLNSAPKIPAQLVKGNLSCAPDTMYDVHLILQGPDYQDPMMWLAFQLIAQHICRMFNELVELKQSPISCDEGIFDVGNSNGFNLNIRKRRHVLAVYTSCGVKSEDLMDTLTKLPNFIASLPKLNESVWSFQNDLIDSMIHNGWLICNQEFSLRAEFELVNSLTTWAKYVKPRVWSQQFDSTSEEKDVDTRLIKTSFKYSCAAKKMFDFLRAQRTQFWVNQYQQFWVDQSCISVVRPTNDLILYPANLIASTSAIGGCFGTQELLREKQWEDLVDEEVDGYLQSIGV